MTTYNTRNPVPSTDVRDLYDNAENLDTAVNNRSTRTWVDRLGVGRKTWWGMEQDFQDFLLNSGYQDLGDYTAGMLITARNQVFARGGELWRAGPSLTLPYTTTGNWALEGSNFVSVGDAALRSQLAAPGGSNIVAYTAAGVGAVTRSLQTKIRETCISITDFGAVSGPANDSTVAFNAALTAAFNAGLPLWIPPGVWMVQDTTAQGAAIINPGVSMIGAGRQRSMIIPGPSHPIGSNIMRVKPAANVSLDFWRLLDFMIYPGYSGALRGATPIYIDTTNPGINAGCVRIEGLHIMPSNGYSIQWINHGPTNAQGNPSNSIFAGNSIWDGFVFMDCGDNVRIVDSAILSSAGTFHAGIVHTAVNASGGVAAGFHVARNASNCDGGFLQTRAGHMIVVEDNNYEQSKGTGSGNGAMIDLQGDVQMLGGGRICGNAFGVFGTTTINCAIRIAFSVGVRVDQNRMLAGITVATGLRITAGATDTIVGSNAWGTLVPQTMEDNGVGTRGVYQALTLSAGFTNAPSGQAFSCFKDIQGQMRLGGLINHAGFNTPALIGILPVGKRPFASQTMLAWGLSGGNYRAISVTVGTDGNISLDPGGATITQVSLGSLTFLTSPTIVSNT